MLRLCCGVSQWDALLKLSSCSALHFMAAAALSGRRAQQQAPACLDGPVLERPVVAHGELSRGARRVLCVLLQGFHLLLCVAARRGLQAGIGCSMVGLRAAQGFGV